MQNLEKLKRQEEEIKDKLLEAIQEKSVYSIRTLRKKLKKIQEEQKQYVLHLPNYKSDK